MDWMYLLESLAYLVVIILFMLFGKWLQDWHDKKLDHDIREENSYAAALRRGGMLLGIAIGMMGLIVTDSFSTFLDDLLQLALEGVQVLFFIVLATLLTYQLVSGRIKLNSDYDRQNIGASIVYFCIAVATGLIAYGSFTGEGGAWWNPLLFFALGQLVLILVSLLYEVSTRWNVRGELLTGNPAAGMLLGGMILVLGIILRAALSGPSAGLLNDSLAFGLSALYGIVIIIFVLLPVIDHLFLPGTNIKREVVDDRTPAPILMVVLGKIGLALVISALI